MSAGIDRKVLRDFQRHLWEENAKARHERRAIGEEHVRREKLCMAIYQLQEYGDGHAKLKQLMDDYGYSEKWKVFK